MEKYDQDAVLLLPLTHICLTCKKNLKTVTSTVELMLYGHSGTKPAKLFTMQCCGSTYHHSFYIDKNKQLIYYQFFDDSKFLQTSNQTAFERPYLDEISSYNALTGISFESIANTYNFTHRNVHRSLIKSSRMRIGRLCKNNNHSLDLNNSTECCSNSVSKKSNNQSEENTQNTETDEQLRYVFQAKLFSCSLCVTVLLCQKNVLNI